jgi:superfamily II DNA/RNA helicase
MVMFSATWPLAVHKLAQEFMDPNPIKVVLFLSVFFLLSNKYLG